MKFMLWTKRAGSDRRQDISPSPSTRRALVVAAALMVTAGSHAMAQSAGSYQVTPILSDGYATAPVIDPNFIDPWGFNNAGTFWINANVTGYSYVNGINGAVKLKAIVPAANGTGTGKPTGIVKNTTTAFLLSNGAVPSFIFGTLDGTISGWNGALGGTLPSLIMVNNSAANAVYTDIALDPSANGTVLLAANFGAGGKVEIYNQSYAPTTLAGTFTDPNVPSGYAPYAIHVISGQVYVTYMLRSTTAGSGGYGNSGTPSYAEILGPNTGFVSVFDVNGNFLSRAITGGNLNAPWGMALAPASFGVYGGDLLVGNLGDGLINVYNPTTFAYLGQLTDATGKPVLYSLPGAGIANSYIGLWEIGFGQGNAATGSPAIASSGDPSILYFAAGLDAEQHGLFGSISAVAPSGSGTFSFSSSTPVLTVKAGQMTSATLALAPINGFAGTVSLACSGLPVDSTCSFSPTTVALNASAPATTTVTINTNTSTAGLAHPGGAITTFAGLSVFPAGLLVLLVLGRRRNVGGLRVMVFAVMAAAATSAIAGCSGTGASAPITPPGTSAIKVTATSGTLSQTTTINLTVQ